MTLGINVEVREIPEEYRAQAEEYREKLIEAVAEFDEDLMEQISWMAKNLQSQKSKQQFVKRHLLLNSTLLYVELLSKTKVSNSSLTQLSTTFHHHLISLPMKGTNPDTEEEVERHSRRRTSRSRHLHLKL